MANGIFGPGRAFAVLLLLTLALTATAAFADAANFNLGDGTTDIVASFVSTSSAMMPEGEKVVFNMSSKNAGTEVGRIETYNIDYGDGSGDALWKYTLISPQIIAAGAESIVKFEHVYRKPGKYAATFDFVSSNDNNAENNKVAVDVTTTGQGPGLLPLDKNVYETGEEVHFTVKHITYGVPGGYTELGPGKLTIVSPGGAIFNVDLSQKGQSSCDFESISRTCIEYAAAFDPKEGGEYAVTLSGVMRHPSSLAFDDKASFTVVLPPECQQLSDIYMASYESSCGDARYNPVADLDKDKYVTIADYSLLQAHSSDAEWCGNSLSNADDPCMPTECQSLLTRIKTSYGGTCLLGTKSNYDAAADLDGSKTIDISDFSRFASNAYNAAWCADKVDNAPDPCVPEVPAACQQLMDTIKASYPEPYAVPQCDAKYNPVADLNRDKSITGDDMLLLSANLGDAAWCSDKLGSTEDPCSAATLVITEVAQVPGVDVPEGKEIIFNIEAKNVGKLPANGYVFSYNFGDGIGYLPDDLSTGSVGSFYGSGTTEPGWYRGAEFRHVYRKPGRYAAKFGVGTMPPEDNATIALTAQSLVLIDSIAEQPPSSAGEAGTSSTNGNSAPVPSGGGAVNVNNIVTTSVPVSANAVNDKPVRLQANADGTKNKDNQIADSAVVVNNEPADPAVTETAVEEQSVPRSDNATASGVSVVLNLIAGPLKLLVQLLSGIRISA